MTERNKKIFGMFMRSRSESMALMFDNKETVEKAISKALALNSNKILMEKMDSELSAEQKSFVANLTLATAYKAIEFSEGVGDLVQRAMYNALQGQINHLKKTLDSIAEQAIDPALKAMVKNALSRETLEAELNEAVKNSIEDADLMKILFKQS